jgi:2-polyprenyl-6-hydroxyphenyl methylase/3-demethylubiquinone-9 3-methyltransferase
LKRWGTAAGLIFVNLSGLRYLPFIGYAALCRSTSMNYLMHFKRKENDGPLAKSPVV